LTRSATSRPQPTTSSRHREERQRRRAVDTVWRLKLKGFSRISRNFRFSWDALYCSLFLLMLLSYSQKKWLHAYLLLREEGLKVGGSGMFVVRGPSRFFLPNLGRSNLCTASCRLQLVVYKINPRFIYTQTHHDTPICMCACPN
jgi:hypothetical protein